MEIKQAIEMTELLLVDNEKGIDSLGKYGDEVAVKLLSKVNELQEDNNACACEIAVLKHLLREKTAEAEQLIKQVEKASLTKRDRRGFGKTLIEVGALRQYRHNNNDDFVFAYDLEETESIVNKLTDERDNAITLLCKIKRIILHGKLTLSESVHEEIHNLTKQFE